MSQHLQYFVHFSAIILVIAVVTVGLKIDDGKQFLREFWKALGGLLAGYAAVAVVIFFLAWSLGKLF